MHFECAFAPLRIQTLTRSHSWYSWLKIDVLGSLKTLTGFVRCDCVQVCGVLIKIGVVAELRSVHAISRPFPAFHR